VREAIAFGVRGHVRALELRDMSRRVKAATCRRTPNLCDGRTTLLHLASKKRRLSLYERAKDLCGTVRGSKDLSTRPWTG